MKPLLSHFKKNCDKICKLENYWLKMGKKQNATQKIKTKLSKKDITTTINLLYGIKQGSVRCNSDTGTNTYIDRVFECILNITIPFQLIYWHTIVCFRVETN